MVLLIPFLLLELYFSLEMGERIGFLWSVVWILSSMTFGIALLRNSPHAIVENLQAVQRGKLNFKRFQDASMYYFVGALLLIVPGVLSDFLGLIALSYTAYLQFLAKITPEQPNFTSHKGEEDDVIDVEIIDERSDYKRCS
jgi:UPF0716 family protein affecting phage T7 exclusion